MKRFTALLVIAFALVAAPTFAQQATLNSSETLTATKIVVSSIGIDAVGRVATLSFQLQAADGTVKRGYGFVAVGADYTSFCTALGSARTSETGTVDRRLQFRVIGWMSDNSKFTDPNGNVIAVTVVP